MRPLILDLMIRIDPLPLFILCAVEGLAILGLALRIPYVRGQARRDGRVHARPDLEGEKELYRCRWEARGEKIDDQAGEMAHLRGELAKLKGAATNFYRVADEPTKEQVNLALLYPRRKLR
jgi:hypothetical protein